MQYSLLSRFQGCLLGMTLGEQLGLYLEVQQFHPLRSPNQPPESAARLDVLPDQFLPNLHHWHPGIQPLSTVSSKDITWSRLALCYLEALIQTGTWSIEAHQPPAIQFSTLKMTDGGLAIATLPIALFFHDNLVKQRRQLEETVQAWCNNFDYDRVVTFGYAIAQALKEQLQPHTLIAQLLAYLRVTANASGGAVTQWFTELEHARTLLKTGADLSTAAQSWQSSGTRDCRKLDADAQAIAIALYCFLSTPNDVRLAILRAARIGYHPSLVCALTGALSGAYNSVTGIPVDWGISSPIQPINAWELHLLQIHQLSSRLLAVWSGVYDASTLQTSSLAVAAPWVIRPQ